MATEKPEKKRATRVSQRIREELALIFAREMSDPRLAGVIVARVEMSDDLRSGRVYIRLLQGGDDAARRKATLAQLGRIGGRIRGSVSERAGLRYAPELRYFYDEGQDHAAHIEALLDEVRREPKNE